MSISEFPDTRQVDTHTPTHTLERGGELPGLVSEKSPKMTFSCSCSFYVVNILTLWVVDSLHVVLRGMISVTATCKFIWLKLLFFADRI